MSQKNHRVYVYSSPQSPNATLLLSKELDAKVRDKGLIKTSDLRYCSIFCNTHILIVSS